MSNLEWAARRITRALPTNIEHPDQRQGTIAVEIEKLIDLRDALKDDHPWGVPKTYCHICGMLLPAGTPVRAWCARCKGKQA